MVYSSDAISVRLIEKSMFITKKMDFSDRYTDLNRSSESIFHP